MVGRNIKKRGDAVPRQGFSIVFLHPVTNALIEEIPARQSRFRQRRHHFPAPVQQAQHQRLNNGLILRGSAQVRQGHQHRSTFASFRMRKLNVSLRRHGSPVTGIMKHQPQPRRRKKNAQQHDRSFKHRDAGGLGGKKQHFPRQRVCCPVTSLLPYSPRRTTSSRGQSRLTLPTASDAPR